MPGITQYDQYMQEPTGKGRIASYIRCHFYVVAVFGLKWLRM